MVNNHFVSLVINIHTVTNLNNKRGIIQSVLVNMWDYIIYIKVSIVRFYLIIDAFGNQSKFRLNSQYNLWKLRLIFNYENWKRVLPIL